MSSNGRTSQILILVAFVAFAFLQAKDIFFPPNSLSIASGSENRSLEPIVTDWGDRNGVEVNVTYMGSVDISRELAQGTEGRFDVVWPANSLWIELGDRDRVVTHSSSVMRSPVVLGVRRSIAEDLGWIGREDITVQMIGEAARSGAFRLAMTSATQSNSGASAYLGFLYALSGNPDVLTMEHLEDATLREEVRALLSTVERSSGSSGWLKDALLASPDAYDAMFNYEAIILETNTGLAQQGREPLYIIYPENGVSVADSPLAYVSKGDTEKEAHFLALQDHLLSPEVQADLLKTGRRAGLLGLSGAQAAGDVWNPEWGADPERQIASVPVPSSDVIREALRLYQMELRKPSLTIWVLDVSGSMEGEPLAELKRAMGMLLDPEMAALNLLEPSERDLTAIIAFNQNTGEPIIINGNNPVDLAWAKSVVEGLHSGGGTDLYGAVMAAFELLRVEAGQRDLTEYLPAIVAMTDGASDQENRAAMLAELAELQLGTPLPIHAIAFGEADEQQLEELSRETVGRLFYAGDDLAKAMRSAKGYN